jgi:hypothetical protein
MPERVGERVKKPSALEIDSARAASAARGEIEIVLDAVGWPWRPQLSRWIDLLLVLEERA